MDLLERFASGDLEAFESLFRQHQKEIYAWIVRIVRDSGVAEDLTVETFWRIYRSRARFRPEGNFAAWARRIATNAALDHLRRNRREIELPEDLPSSPQPDSALQSEHREKIREAFTQLPARYRLVATLALIEDEPYDKIAEALGVSAALVKIRVFRAVRMLRKTLTAMGVTTGGQPMTHQNDQNLRELLKQYMPGASNAQLSRDLWPQMLERLNRQTVYVPWFDWVLAALAGAVLIFFPGILPALLYHL